MINPETIQSWKRDVVTQELFSLLKLRREEISEYLVKTDHTDKTVPYVNRLVGSVDAIDMILSLDVFNQGDKEDEA